MIYGNGSEQAFLQVQDTIHGDVTPWDVTPLGMLCLGDVTPLGRFVFIKHEIRARKNSSLTLYILVCSRMRVANWNYRYGSVSHE